MQLTENRNLRSGWLAALVLGMSATSVTGADIVGTKKYMYMAVLNSSETAVVATQDNLKLLVQLDFDHAGGSVTGSSGFSLGTAFSLDSVSAELGPNQVYLELDSVNPADVASGAVGTVDMDIADAGGPLTFTVDVAFRKLSDVAFTVFDGYVTTTPPAVAGDVQIVPASIKHAPPAGWGTAYAWGTGSFSGLPLGLTIDIVPDAGAAKVDGYVASYGGGWVAQDGSFELLISSLSAAWENSCIFTSALSLRVLSDITLFENEILPKSESAFSGAAADSAYVVGSPVVTGAATISINNEGLVTGFSATDYPQDQSADVPVTDGSRPQCTPTIDISFRTRSSDGYTIMKGHLDGEDNIVGAAASGFTVGTDGSVSMSGGGAVTLSFESSAAVSAGPMHVGGSNTWNDDGSFVMRIQDGSRPSSRLNSALSLRKFPDDGMTYFNQQDNAQVEPALGNAAEGMYEIIAVEPEDSDVPLTGGVARPVFDTSGALVDFLNPSYPEGSSIVNLRVTDGGRPYSVTELAVDQRWITNDADVQATSLVFTDPDADFELRIRDSQTWDWQSPDIPGLSAGSIVLVGKTTSVDAALFDLTGADGDGSLVFELARAEHPTVTIKIPFAVGPSPGIPVASKWAIITMTLLLLIVGTVIAGRSDNVMDLSD